MIKYYLEFFIQKGKIMLLNKEVKLYGEYDLVVCGGGFSGFATAYSAAREGLKVLLIEKNGCLGGVGTSCLVNHILGERLIDKDFKLTDSIKGLFSTIEERLLKDGSAIDSYKINFKLNPHGWYPFLGTGLIFNGLKMKILLEQMLQEQNVEILFQTSLIDVKKEKDVVEGVFIFNKDGISFVKSKLFCDATGDADLIDFCKLDTLYGDGDGGVAPASLEMHVDNVDTKMLSNYMKKTKDFRFRNIIEKLKESNEWKFPYEIFISVMLTEKDTYMINTIRQVGVDGRCSKSISNALVSGRSENLELFEIMKKHFPGFKNCRIKDISDNVGIRESRRIIGEYTLTVNDLIDGKKFDDCIASSSYGWDLPNSKKPSLQPMEKVERKSPFTNIPFRTLIPKNLSNVIVVGRCISVEREVLGPVRVMGPCIAMGEASGIACYYAIKENKPFKDLDVKKIQKRIIKYGGIYEKY